MKFLYERLLTDSCTFENTVKKIEPRGKLLYVLNATETHCISSILYIFSTCTIHANLFLSKCINVRSVIVNNRSKFTFHTCVYGTATPSSCFIAHVPSRSINHAPLCIIYDREIFCYLVTRSRKNPDMS